MVKFSPFGYVPGPDLCQFLCFMLGFIFRILDILKYMKVYEGVSRYLGVYEGILTYIKVYEGI